MLNLLVFLFAVTCIAISAAWLAEQPGAVTLYWFDYRIDTSLAFLLASVLIAALAISVLYLLIRGLLHVPETLRRSRETRHYKRGISEITYSVAALAAADIHGAEKHTKKAERLLGRTPLTLMLSAQVAKSRGDEDKTRALMEEMLSHKETEYLAARSLSDAASQKQLYPRALNLAQRAYKVGPKDTISASAMVSLHLRLNQWQEALAAIDSAVRKRGITRAQAKHYRAVVHTQQGLALLKDNRAQDALRHAQLAHKLLPDFLPATLLHARTLAAAGEQAKAIKVLMRQWKKAPNAALAALFTDLIKTLPDAQQIKLARKLAATAINHEESDMTLARVWMRHKNWSNARKALASAIAKRETARACKLMAQLEQEGFNDFDAAGNWYAKSAQAIEDTAWRCESCRLTAEAWDAYCAHCGAFDTIGWK